MVITGAGPGIMEAGIEGAGAANSLRCEHPAAVRGRDHAVPRRRPEARQLPLLLHAQGHVREGGARVRAAARRLRHARRGVRAADARADRASRRPRRSCCSTCPAARTGGAGCSSSSASCAQRGYISPADLELVKITDDVRVALDEITGFYRNYHSLRFVDGDLVLRMQTLPSRRRARRAQRPTSPTSSPAGAIEPRRGEQGRDRRRRRSRPRRACGCASTATPTPACPR